uniref:TBP-like factor n=1 Tax=Bursaphelenchus xylophilus TaxID=6326 RepID=A0A1I7S1E1_BURXY
MYCLAPPTQTHQTRTEPAPPGNPSTSQDAPNVESEEIDIQIRNVVCNYSLPLHIDLRKVAMNSGNVTFDRDRGVLYKQKRNPQCHVKVYSSGNVYIVGCRSEDDCRRAARSVGRMIQRSMGLLDAQLRLRDYKICNVLATCRLPFGVKIEEMAAKYKEAQYEPELSVGLVWKFTEPKASLRIHTTGSITVTGGGILMIVRRNGKNVMGIES